VDEYPIEQPGPLAEVAAIYAATARPLAFRARTREEVPAWREALRTRLKETLNVPHDVRPLAAETVSRETPDGYTRELVVLRAPVGGVPVYVLRPDGAGPFRPVIAMHGHGPGVRDAIGLEQGEEEHAHVVDLNTRLAVALVQRGFLVFAPEQLGFGGRREAEDKALGSMASSCRQASLSLLLLGHTMAGLRVRDIQRTLEYAGTHPDARRGGIGGVGFSGGGTALLYAAALDERLGALVLSGCVTNYLQSIMAVSHCEDNYLPGVLTYAELGDIVASLAPRPLFVESGMDDDIYPASATVATVTQVRKAYTLLGAGDRVELEVFAGGHRFHGTRSLEWLGRRL
jgi:dienelactone hydrolase